MLNFLRQGYKIFEYKNENTGEILFQELSSVTPLACFFSRSEV